jgi:hypothetical protein
MFDVGSLLIFDIEHALCIMFFKSNVSVLPSDDAAKLFRHLASVHYSMA